MNAILSEPIDAEAAEEARIDELSRKIHGVERSWLDSALNDWGNWIEQNSDYEGYPRADAIASWLEGGGGSRRGHRVLCLDMPHRIYSMHARWLLLPEHEQIVVWTEYVPRLKETNEVWTSVEKASRIGVGPNVYRKRLQRARLRILGLAV